jgi:hypothetical protein
MTTTTTTWMERVQELVAKGVALHGRLLWEAEKLPGFGFAETMRGTVVRTDGTEGGRTTHRVELPMTPTVSTLGEFLREGRTELSGRGTIEGLAEDVPLSGGLWIWPHRRVIRYEIHVEVQGETWALVGQKDVRVLDFARTMTHRPTELLDAQGQVRGHGTVVFAWRDLPNLLRSAHLVQQHTR